MKGTVAKWRKVPPETSIESFPPPRRSTAIFADALREKAHYHSGCLDFTTMDGYEARVRRRGQMIHDELAQVASEIIGIDNARDAVEQFRSQHQRTDIVFGDAERSTN